MARDRRFERAAAVVRKAHTVLAYTLFLTVLGHLSAILFHTLIVMNVILRRMLWRR